MRRECVKARLLRALSGKTQEQIGGEIGVHPSLIAQFELGLAVPSPDHLQGLARATGLTGADAEEILRLVERLRRPQLRQGAGAADLLDAMADTVRSLAGTAWERLLTLPLPESPPRPEDRGQAGELWERFEAFPGEIRLAVVQVAGEFQSWALCERVCDESVRAASRDVEEAAELAHLSREIADRVRGPEGWRRRLQGYAAAHGANALRVAGEHEASEAAFEEARRLWYAGADPGGVLDAGRLPDLEASLRRDQRRFVEALGLLEEAEALSGRPERALIKRGITQEKMGDYRKAVEALRQAASRFDRQSDPRQGNILDFNLAVNLCHLGRYAEAAELMPQIREGAVETKDALALVRLTWLRGRIAAGLGRSGEALALLEEARREFEHREMWYDVALALLEEAVLLLEEARAAEVKEVAKGLVKVFESKGVHREALAALRLFQEAAEHEAATADLAGRVLRFLFRARWDEKLRFGGEGAPFS